MSFSKGIVDCKPEDQGYDSSREVTLIHHFEKLMEENKIQGASYCVTRYGKTILHGAVGRFSYRKEDERLYLPTSVNQIASITKTFTTVAIMKLVEDGFTRLATPVGEILPQFSTPPFNEITLFHLLTHTSGLWPDDGCYENKHRKNAFECIELFYNLAEDKEKYDWIAAALADGMRLKPSEEWQYCSFGFCILGAVIEKITGISAEEYIQRNIIDPLGMKDTGFVLTPELAKRAIVRHERGEEYLNKIISGEIDSNAKEGNIWDKIPRTGGGIHSTPYDLTRFGNMMLGNGRLGDVRILGRPTVEKITTLQLHNVPDHCWRSNNPDRRYGIGFDMRQGLDYLYNDRTYFHEGAGACCMTIDPVEQLVAAFFVPFATDNWYSEPLYNTINIIWSGII